MLTLPRVPIAKEVPREVKPDQLLAHFVTIGWLLDGVKSGRIPKPSEITDANATMATLRLSFLQKPGAARRRATSAWRSTKPLIFNLKTGPADRRARAERERFASCPPTENVDGTYPWLYITFVRIDLVANRPVRFQLANVTAPFAQVCAAPGLIRAARLAGERAYPTLGG